MSRRNQQREIQVPLSRIEERRGGLLLLHGSRSHHSHSMILEDRIAIQHREIQSLLSDNQQLASGHVALKHDLSAAEHDLRVLSVTASDIKAERDAEIRDVYERSLKLDAEARAVDAMTSELARVQADLHQFGSARQDLTAQLQAIEDDLARVREDSQEVPEIKAEIEIMRKEIQRGRAAIEYEKKTRVSNLEQRQVMERSMISMANEIEKLHAELANADFSCVPEIFQQQRRRRKKKMASEEAEKKQEEQQGASYTYWVRQVKEGDAAPLPVPRKLTPDDIINDSNSQPPTLGSLWNKAGTWEEKNLHKWASDRIKELLISVGSLEFPAGKAEISDVSKCAGDAFLVTVRNKKRVGYTYELTLKVKGEWTIREEKKMVKGHIDIPEFSFGELDDLQMEVRLSEEKDLLHQDKSRISQDLKLFLQPIREKMLQFEQELKDR